MKYARVFFSNFPRSIIRVYKLERSDWTTRFLIYLHQSRIKNLEYLLLLLRPLNTSIHFQRLWEGKIREWVREKGGVDRWKIWTEFNQFVCCPSAIEAMFRKSIATCYWNDPIHPGGFFIPEPSASAEVCTTVHGYGNPISDIGQKRLRMSRVAKIYRLIDVPGHTVPPFSTWNHDTRFYAPVNPARELSTLSFPSFFFSLSPSSSREIHFSSIREGDDATGVEQHLVVGKSEEVFVHLMDITDKQRNPYRNIYIVKFLFRGYNFSSPGDGYCWKTIHRRGSNVSPPNICYLRFTMLINLLVDTFSLSLSLNRSR